MMEEFEFSSCDIYAVVYRIVIILVLRHQIS